MHMLSERFQVLLSTEQKQRLEAEAKRRGVSVGGLVREAIDGVLGGPTAEDRARALERISARSATTLSIEELNGLLARRGTERWDRLERDGRGV